MRWRPTGWDTGPARIDGAVDIATLDGRDLAGRAVLVRSVDGAHVLRGDGPLAGITAADLS